MPEIDTVHAASLALALAGAIALLWRKSPLSKARVPLVASLLVPVWVSAAVPAGADGTAAVDAPPPHELSIDHIAHQPANMITCSYGYWAEKSGDHATANAIFDRCIEAGYVGAMIWKALLYEEGNGVPQDSAKAAALLHRAATSGDSGYATLGKLHYATALYLGKGVARDEAEAMKWFREAAAEGSEEAQEFLRTGHHTGDRDLQARGVGEQPWQIQGQRLERTTAAADVPSSGAFRLGPWLVAVLVMVFAAGLLRQVRIQRRLAMQARGRAVAEGV